MVIDGRAAVVSWNLSAGVDFYILRYGVGRDRLFGSYQVDEGMRLEIHSLNARQWYWFAVGVG